MIMIWLRNVVNVELYFKKNFQKNITKNDGLNSNCKLCRKQFCNEFLVKLKKNYIEIIEID